MRIEGTGVGLNNYGQGVNVGGLQRGREAGQAQQVNRAAPLGMEYAADGKFGPAVTVEISPQAREAYAKAQESGEVKECQTCKNRKYQDGSSDASVSFQSPTHISPGSAPGAVAAHEGEHVAHEQAKAAKEGRKVVSQSVTISTSVCPECGRVYVSGGETRTVTMNKPKNPKPEDSKTENKNPDTYE